MWHYGLGTNSISSSIVWPSAPCTEKMVQGAERIREAHSRSISRVLSDFVLTCPDGHFSWSMVAHALSSSLPAASCREDSLSLPIWPCSSWGLPCRPCYHERGGLLPHLFTLTLRQLRPSAVCFLWHCPSRIRAAPIHRSTRIMPRRYLAACPWSPDFPRYATHALPRPSGQTMNPP